MRATKAIINLKAIQHNLSVIGQLAPDSKIMAVIKADAYGHGICQVANSLNNADAIAVACIDEAIKLREAKVTLPIVLLEGFFSYDELSLIQALDLQIIVHQQSQVDALVKFSQKSNHPQPITIWLKFDSGMNRLGLTQAEFLSAYQALADLNLIKTINLMSHLACADDINHVMNVTQIDRFKQVIQSVSIKQNQAISMANSAGVIAWPESHFDWVRPGIALYGCSPMKGYKGSAHHLIPAMTLESQLFATRQLVAGDSVGYGSSWIADKATRIGVIAIGYGDGYPRHIEEGTPVWIKDKLYPIVGQVSMDMLTIDLGQDDIVLGERAVLWGEELPVETIAEHANTIAYTLLCGVTSRVKFEWR